MAAHSSILAWRSPGTEEPGGLWPTGSHRIRCATNAKPSWQESAPPARSGAQALLFPGGCPSQGPHVSPWSVGKAAMEAGGGTFRVQPGVNLERELCIRPPLSAFLLLHTVWHLFEQLGCKIRVAQKRRLLLRRRAWSLEGSLALVSRREAGGKGGRRPVPPPPQR